MLKINDDDIKHNAGEVGIDYRNKVEADANHQNLINGITNIDLNEIKLNEYKQSKISAQRVALSIIWLWTQVTQIQSDGVVGRIENVVFNPKDPNILHFYFRWRGLENY